VSLVEQWREIESGLPEGWGGARLALSVRDEGQSDRAAALLAPAGPGRSGRKLRFSAVRSGPGSGPDAVTTMLRRLDRERIGGELELLGTDQAQPRQAAPHTSLAEDWTREEAKLPSDWSDLLCELDLTSTDHLDPAALRLVPLNPGLLEGATGFRFRVARRRGYGGSPEMTRRCLERLDEIGIPGRLRIVRALSDTGPVATQGPVWYVGGKVL
jgi:hypothetical protein